MKLVVQRVLNGSVSVNNNLVGSINQGVIVLVGFGKNDSIDQSEILFPWAKKHIMNLRLWPDEKEKGKAWKHSVLDKGLGVLLISQFTLYGIDFKFLIDFFLSSSQERPLGGGNQTSIQL